MPNQEIKIAEILANLNLHNINIPYDSYSLTKLKLNTSTNTKTIKYGFLRENITFLLLKISYDDQNPLSIIEENQHIEYWFEDQPTIKRKSHKLLLFTGNSTKRIPQIYLRNTSGLKVDIDILMANLPQEDLDTSTFPNEIITYFNLYYNSVCSDTYWNATANISGSSQFEIYDLEDNRLIKIPYKNISTFTLNQNNSKIIIEVNTERKTYVLDFVNKFETNQANSRMLWVMDNKYIRYLSKTNPILDIIKPIIIMNSGLTQSMTGTNIYDYTYVTGITSDNILNYFISGITDNRDGIIDINSSNIEIYNSDMVLLSIITEIGLYDIIIYKDDNANNRELVNYILNVI